MARPVEREVRLAPGNRLVDAADVDACLAVARHLEIVLRAEVRGCRRWILARYDLRMAGRPEYPDRLEFGKRRLDPSQPLMQPRFIGRNFRLGAAPKQIIDAVEGEVHGLEHFQRLFLHDLERAFDSLVCQRLCRAIAQPAGKQEQQQRQQQCGTRQSLQQANGREARARLLGRFGNGVLRRRRVGHNRDFPRRCVRPEEAAVYRDGVDGNRGGFTTRRMKCPDSERRLMV